MCRVANNEHLDFEFFFLFKPTSTYGGMIYPPYFLKPYGFWLFLLDFENISTGSVLQCLLKYISAVLRYVSTYILTCSLFGFSYVTQKQGFLNFGSAIFFLQKLADSFYDLIMS